MRPEKMAAGAELPGWTVTPDLTRLVRYASSSGDFYPLHYDREFAAEQGFPGFPVQGLLKTAWLGQLVTGWLRPGDRLLSLEASYRGMDYCGEPIACGGRVTEVGEVGEVGQASQVGEVDQAGEVGQDAEVGEVAGPVAEIELWTESADGRRATLGRAVVRLAR
jgi:acyl dehydratase